MARAKKQRRFQIVLTGTIPEGMTLAQVRYAYWNDGFNGDRRGDNFTTKDVDIDDYFAGFESRRPMRVRLGRISLIKGA
jgi:hypothetical protein